MTSQVTEIICSGLQDAICKKENLLLTFCDLNVYSEEIEGAILTTIYAPSGLIKTVFRYS